MKERTVTGIQVARLRNEVDTARARSRALEEVATDPVTANQLVALREKVSVYKRRCTKLSEEVLPKLEQQPEEEVKEIAVFMDGVLKGKEVEFKYSRSEIA